MGDQRIHLALAHLGRLKQGRLLTLCNKLAVTQLSPFAAAAAKAADRCRTCFGKVDDDGMVKAEAPTNKSPARPQAEVVSLAEARKPRTKPAPPKANPSKGRG